MSHALSAILSELKTGLTDLYGSRLVDLVLFGSQARGDATPESDIDVLVVLAGEVDPYDEVSRISTLTASISLKHDMVINCLFVSAERYSKGQSPLLLNVRREGVPV